MPALTIQLLGGFSVLRDGRPITAFRSDKVRALLAYLVLEPGRSHRRDTLAALLWPEQPEATARANLRLSLHRLRAALSLAEGELLGIARDHVRLVPGADLSVDAAELERLLDACDQHAHHDGAVCTDCLERLEQAVSGYRGDLLAGLSIDDSEPFAEWVALRREELQRRVAHACTALAEGRWRRGDPARAAVAARRGLALDPWDEAAHCRLMRILAARGDAAGALAQYARWEALAAELGLEPAPESAALAARIRALQGRPRHNLPAPVSSFHGRVAELKALGDRLVDPASRLICIAGPGGAGKSRLALAAARAHADSYLDGAWLVSLEVLTDPADLAASILIALEAPPHNGGRAAQALRDYLHSKELLLVLDGMEQLLAGRDLLVKLLQAASGLTILITSRECLALPGEWVLPLGGLDLSAAGAAVELFRQRARQSTGRPGWNDDPDDLTATICKALEGLPLAIELAASWTDRLTLAEILAALETDDALNLDLQPLIARVWQRLDLAQRRALTRLAICRDGFDQAAALAIGDATPVTLAALLRMSLLAQRVLEPGATPRLALHDSVRRAMLARLTTDHKEHLAASARHGAHYGQILAGLAPQMRGAAQPAAIRQIRDEERNLRLAWEWALATGELTLIGPGLEVWLHYFEITGRMAEGEALYAAAVRTLSLLQTVRPSDITLTHVGAFAGACHGWYAMRCGQRAAAEASLKESLRLARELDDAELVAINRHCFGALAVSVGAFEQAETHLVAALEHFTAAGAHWWVGGASLNRAWIAMARGEFAVAAQLTQHALAAFGRIGDSWGIAIALQQAADLAWRQGDVERAERQYYEVIAIREAIGQGWRAGQTLQRLGAIAWARGDGPQAIQLLEEGHARLLAAGYRSEAAAALLSLGAVYGSQGDSTRARSTYRATLELAAEAEVVPIVLGGLLGVAELPDELSDRAYAWAQLVANHPASGSALRERAQRLITTLTEYTGALDDGCKPTPSVPPDLWSAVAVILAIPPAQPQ
jgi:DNA-binding SARP family transcriptional activator/predicted ATPase